MSAERGRTNNLITSLQVLNQIGASILSEHTPAQIIEVVYHHLNQLIDAYSFAIGIYNPVSRRFEYTGARENYRKVPDFSVAAHSPERFSGWVFEHKTSVLINDYEQEYHLYLPQAIKPFQGAEPSSLMFVPVFIQQEVAGILSVRTIRKNAYDMQSLEILKTLSVFIGKALENARAIRTQGYPVLKPPGSYYLDPLSARELEILSLLVKGYTNKAIAAALFVSPSTVKTHTLNIYQKLEAANRTEAIFKARQYGLIT